MSLTDLLPLVEQLSNSEKLQLLQWLTSELLQDAELPALNLHHDAPPSGLHDSFEAAAVLAQALAEKQATVHG